jgi:hypothetical protein
MGFNSAIKVNTLSMKDVPIFEGSIRFSKLGVYYSYLSVQECAYSSSFTDRRTGVIDVC